jgi:hypothetical protein
VPDQFEVYPPAAESGLADAPHPAVPSWEQPDTEPAVERYQVTPYIPPPPPVSPGPSRRGLLWLVAAVPVGVLWLGSVARPDADPSFDEDEDEWDGETSPDDTGSGSAIEVGGYSVEVPDGWEATQVSEAEGTATNGANRVQAYAFYADSGDSAADLVSALVSRRLGSFKGDLGTPVDESEGDVQRATVRASGKLSGKPARLVGTLWIDEAGTALLALKIVTAKKGSAIAEEAQAMVDELSGNFG